MGIDHETLRAIKPEIILAHVSAFGPDGPYAERVGFDLLGQAMSGMAYISGTEESPIRSQIPFVDFTTALFAAFGTLSALMAREKTGRGQLVDASLFSSSLAMSNNFLIEEAVRRLGRKPQGNRAFHHAPNDVFRTRDGFIISMVVGNPIFERWARLMGKAEWLSDERFATDQQRGDNGALISETMARWCAERTTAQAVEELEAARVPAGPVYTLREALEDPHAQARQLFQAVAYPGVPGPVPLVDTPVRLSDTPGGIRRRAPTLGEHTEQIMSGLGYSAEEIAALRKARVI
jgi:crotonobetainyl-CoA:carnitine CoA-transferase CaiB-like acyl-CoA transferase